MTFPSDEEISTMLAQIPPPMRTAKRIESVAEMVASTPVSIPFSLCLIAVNLIVNDVNLVFGTEYGVVVAELANNPRVRALAATVAR